MIHAEALAGSDLHKSTRLPSGTLYPMLFRLERAGWLKSYWERVDPAEAGRPRKRLYKLTDKGRRATNKAMAQLGMCPDSANNGGEPL